MTQPTSPLFNILKAIGEGLRRLLSLLLLLSFALITSVVILGSILTHTLSQPQTWENALVETRLVERTRSLTSQLLLSAFSTGSNGTLGELPRNTDWKSIGQALIPAQWLDENAKSLVEVILTWLEAPGSDLPEVLIDLTPIKENLRSSAGTVATLSLLQDVPPCQGETVIVYMGDSLINCLPASWDLTNVAGTIALLIADTFPDQVSMTTLAASGDADQIFQTIAKIKAVYSLWHLALNFGLQISILLLTLYLLLQTKTLVRLVRAFRHPFYAAGTLLLLLFAGWYAFTQWGLNYLFSIIHLRLSLELQTAILDLIRAIGKQFHQPWLVWGIGLILFAITVHIAGVLLERHYKRTSLAGKETPRQHLKIRKQFY